MKELLKFEDIKDTKYYIPCYMPIINEIIKRKGSKSRVAFLLAGALVAIPNIEEDKVTHHFKILSSVGENLGYKHMYAYIEAEYVTKVFQNFQEGFHYLMEEYKKGNITSVFGAPYHLPYSIHYHTPNYAKVYGRDLGIYDHVLGIYGIDEEGVYVWDTTPINRFEKVDLDNFDKFWRGHGEVPGFEERAKNMFFGHYNADEVNPTTKLDTQDVNQIIESGIMTVCCEYIEGKMLENDKKILHTGYRVIDVIIHQLECLFGQGNMEKLNHVINTLFGMKFSRFFLRDIIYDMSIYAEKKYINYLEQMDLLIEKWNQLSLKTLAKQKRGSIDKDSLKQIINELKGIQMIELNYSRKFIDNNNNTKFIKVK